MIASKTNSLIKSGFRFLYKKNNINFYYERKKYYKKKLQKILWLGIEGQDAKITNQFLKTQATIDVYFVVVIEPRSIQQISQYIFQNLNTRQDQSVKLVIMLTQSKLKQFSQLLSVYRYELHLHSSFPLDHILKP